MTADKIEEWKGTQRGPGKLQAALGDPGVAVALRVQAAQALIAIGEADRVMEGLKGLDAAQRTQVAGGLATELAAQLETGKGRGSGQEIKDVLFYLRGSLEGTQQAPVDRQLITWLLADWERRSGAGEHSGPKIIEAVGASAAPAIVAGIAESGAAVPVLAQLLRKVGATSDRAQAAAKLVALGRSQRATSAAVYEGIGNVGGPGARAFLLERAQRGDVEQRVWALRALKADPHADSIDSLHRLLANKVEPPSVRAGAVEALEVIEDGKTVDVLGDLIATHPEEVIRYRSVEAIVACCKSKGAAKLLRVLSPKYTYAESDVADLIEKDLKDLGPVVVPVLRQALSAQSWIARVVAVRLLGQMGGKEDLGALERLAGDRTPLRGWGRSATIGSEAITAAEALRKR